MADSPTLSEELYALHTGLHASCLPCLADAMSREHLNFQQLHLLLWMHDDHRHPTVSQAAAVMGITLGAASRNIAILVGRGLVRRQPDGRDGRAKRLVLTEQGDDLVMRLAVAHFNGVARYADGLTAAQQDQLHAALGPVFGRQDPLLEAA
jgi:DNA-binding MarR family transcriptional regulator